MVECFWDTEGRAISAAGPCCAISVEECTPASPGQNRRGVLISTLSAVALLKASPSKAGTFTVDSHSGLSIYS